MDGECPQRKLFISHDWPFPKLRNVGGLWLGRDTCIRCYMMLLHTMLSLWHTANSMNIFLSWILRNFLLISFIKLERMVWHPSKAFGMQAWGPSQQKCGNPDGGCMFPNGIFSLPRCGKSDKLAAFATATGFCRVRCPTFGVLISLGIFGLA